VSRTASGSGRIGVTVALVAHDEKKAALSRFVRAHHGIVNGFRFMAPEDSARALEGIPLEIESFAPDSMGGDLQIGAAIVEGRVDGVIFLTSPFAASPYEPDVHTLLRVCDLEGVPVATNLASAEILLHHLAEASRPAQKLQHRHDDPVPQRGLRLVPPLQEDEDDIPAERRTVHD
jgi:dephospho-CoA kinase